MAELNAGPSACVECRLCRTKASRGTCQPSAESTRPAVFALRLCTGNGSSGRSGRRWTFPARLSSSASPKVAHDAGHEVGYVEALLLDEHFQRQEAPLADEDRIHAGLVAGAVQHGSHGHDAQASAAPGQSRGEWRSALKSVHRTDFRALHTGQFLDRHARLDAAHARLAEHELAQLKCCARR